jgi:hypothetical protein
LQDDHCLWLLLLLLLLQNLTRRIRQAIMEQRLPDFSRSFLAGMFPAGNVPQWVVDALDVAGISLEGVAKLRPAHSFYEEVKAVQRIPAV